MTKQSDYSARVLKVEQTGDRWAGQDKPAIRLKGHWLTKAGFLADNKVVVENPANGILVLTFKYEPKT